MEIIMPIEWGIIFLGTIAASAYFSYKSGYREGAADGVDTLLHSLAAQGIIEIEEAETEE